MYIQEASQICQKICEAINKNIIGKEDVVKKTLVALIANGHILFEDYPGLGKTQLAKLFSQIIDLHFKRIQFTPDLLPADITGAYIFDLKQQEFFLRQGPIFSQLILADEINRAPPKTQAALLEAMGESQVTIEGNTFKLEKPFWVMATQNPIELEGTFGLPEAQLDRFLVRLRLGYPEIEDENRIISNRITRKVDEMKVDKLIDARTFLEIQELNEQVQVSPDIINYISEIVNATRSHKKIDIGASPRGSLALLALARANALVEGRTYVIPEDVKEFAVPALGHRVILKSTEWLEQKYTDGIIEEILTKVTAPRKDIAIE